MATTQTIAVDWECNSDYTATYDDITSRVISATEAPFPWKLETSGRNALGTQTYLGF